MAKRQLKLYLAPEQVTEPLLYNLSKDFRVITNIRRAEINGERGCVVLEIEGSDEDIEQGLAWVIGKGVEVETLNGAS